MNPSPPFLPAELPETPGQWIAAASALVGAVYAAESGELPGSPPVELGWPGPSPLRLLAICLECADGAAAPTLSRLLLELYSRAWLAERRLAVATARLEKMRAGVDDVLQKTEAAVAASRTSKKEPSS